MEPIWSNKGTLMYIRVQKLYIAIVELIYTANVKGAPEHYFKLITKSHTAVTGALVTVVATGGSGWV